LTAHQAAPLSLSRSAAGMRRLRKLRFEDAIFPFAAALLYPMEASATVRPMQGLFFPSGDSWQSLCDMK